MNVANLFEASIVAAEPGMFLDFSSPPEIARREDMTLGEKLQALARSRNLSQEKLGVILKLSQSQVSNYFNGKVSEGGAKIGMVRVFADYFGVSVDWLCDPGEGMKSEKEFNLDRELRAMIRKIGPQRAYNRLLKIDDDDHAQPAAPAQPHPKMPAPPPGATAGHSDGPGKGSKHRRSSG